MLRQFDVLDRGARRRARYRAERGGVRLRDLALGTAGERAAAGGRRRPPRLRRARHPAGPLLHDHRRRAARLRRQRQRTAAGQGRQLADPPRLRLGQPGLAALVAGTVARHTLVRYDERGCGLSDWDVDDDSFTLDAWVRDLETVVDALGLERFPLLGISQGGPIAITYAARHPERVSHVVVYGTCARATWARADDERAPRARRARRADQDVVGERPARLPSGVRRPVPARRPARACGERSTSCSAARRRRATLTGCGGRSVASTAPRRPGSSTCRP